MNPIYHRPPASISFLFESERNDGKANDNSRLSARKSNMSTSAGIWGGREGGGKRRGGNVKSFTREAIYRFVKFIAQLRFFFSLFFFTLTSSSFRVEIILETLR